ncbi:hypothetical protein NA57DRAFT_60865 [Rhizodiscina lignyota]|uniref:Uncharacterized protein n=1 Tax=Rhizodiscina lignyota TaxID=1504668 RepID=A0A9P4I8Z7_9PEZI|nr:hypothetical protein NA57DRAFT_60865 [Rhizodiscina lignyota]
MCLDGRAGDMSGPAGLRASCQRAHRAPQAHAGDPIPHNAKIEDARAAFADCVRQYTAAVEAYGRAEARRGQTHKPKDAIEVGVLVLKELGAIPEVVEGMLDVMRVQAGLPAIATGDRTEDLDWEDEFDWGSFCERGSIYDSSKAALTT